MLMNDGRPQKDGDVIRAFRRAADAAEACGLYPNDGRWLERGTILHDRLGEYAEQLRIMGVSEHFLPTFLADARRAGEARAEAARLALAHARQAVEGDGAAVSMPPRDAATSRG